MANKRLNVISVELFCTGTNFVILFMRPSVRQVRLTGWGVMLSARSFFCYQTCEYDSLKTNEPILMSIAVSDPRGKLMKRSTLGAGGQRSSRSYKAEDRFGVLAQESFSTSLDRVGFYRATLMHSADYAVARCLSVHPSVRPSDTQWYSVNTAEQILIILFYHQVAPPCYFSHTKHCGNIPTRMPLT